MYVAAFVLQYTYGMTFPIGLLVNSVLLVLTLIVCFRIYLAGNTYNRNPGDTPLQTRMKWRILRGIISLLVLALIATIFNLLSDWLPT